MGQTKFAVTPGFEVGGTLFTAKQLEVLGSVAGPDAKIELTTFKQLYINMDEERAEEAKSQLQEVGLGIHAAGFVTKSLITCNFCKGKEEAGLELARKLDQAISDYLVSFPLKIGYSGCALATGEPLLKDIGIVKMKDSFDIYIGADTKSLKARLATLFLTQVTKEELIPMVQALIKSFQSHGKKKEKFIKYIDRVSIEALRKEVRCVV